MSLTDGHQNLYRKVYVKLIEYFKLNNIILYKICQHSLCVLKLRVHPAPGVHILVAGWTCFSTCAHGRCMLFINFLYDYTEMNPGIHSRVHAFQRLCTRWVHRTNL